MNSADLDLVLAFDAPEVSLAEAGGKGVNLARLTRAGFDVPAGCVVSTAAYHRFVQTTGLDVVIRAELDRLEQRQVTADDASETIRSAFRSRPVPDELALAVADAGARWGDEPLAVRSSATAEDLPDASFAGQQDTFLNVRGATAVLVAVVECWSSLWTARAIEYRSAQRIDHADAAVAVVLQRMVPAEVSGVLFTAHPMTGRRDRTVIDATVGLGEALVSGQVNPDHYELNSATGGVVTAPRPGPGCLSANQLRRLAELGRRVQAEYGSPQDLEWAIADDRLHLLQARAITSLVPVPQPLGGSDGGPLAVWFAFGAFQGVAGPITPLGRSAVATVAAGAGELFGSILAASALGFVGVAADRLWFRLDGLLRHPIGRRVVPRMLSIGEPSSAAIVAALLDDPRLAVGTFRLGPARGLARFGRRVLPKIPQALARPARRRADFDRAAAALVARATERERRASAEADPLVRLDRRVEAARASLRECLVVLLPEFAPIMLTSVVLLARLRRMARRAGADDADRLTLELLRGLPGNVTTDMDLALWKVAQQLRAATGPAAATNGTGLPDDPAWWEFLRRYGMRGVGEIDLGQPRWRERPEQVLSALVAYRSIEDPSAAPDLVYRRAVETAGAAADRLAELAGTGRGTAARVRRTRFMTSRVRALMGARETPKFAVIQVMGIIRAGLLASGADLVDGGLLAAAEDVSFLALEELQALTAPGSPDLLATVEDRRSAAERETRRRQVPRIILGDGQVFFEAAAATDDRAQSGTLAGAPVSPGAVEGRVRVVLDPHTGGLQHGEILVCPGTDPAWTPLFLVAGGLVTEVGGMMTHGSVVAREYGIPAVVGVHEATTRLVTGQRVRLDGNAGTVVVLDAEPAPLPQ